LLADQGVGAIPWICFSPIEQGILTGKYVASAITGGSRPQQVKDNAAAAGSPLSSTTLAGIDEALGDAVERDGSLVGSMSPENRPT